MPDTHVDETLRGPVCPVCGNDDDILYVDLLDCPHPLVWVGDAALRAGANDATDGEQDGSGYPCFECQQPMDVPGGICGHRWPVRSNDGARLVRMSPPS